MLGEPRRRSRGVGWMALLSRTRRLFLNAGDAEAPGKFRKDSRMIEAAGLTGRVFITNTVFWRPPGNRTPTPEEQAICAPFVERAVQLVNPRLLLLVGGASAKSMLKQDQGILSLRGRWLEWRSGDQALALPAMPTLHPAFLLRQPAAKKNAWLDILTLAERLDRPEREP